MKYGNRTPFQRLVRSHITLVLASIFFVILAKASWNVHQKAVASSLRLSEAQSELAKLKDRQTDLSSKVDFLSTDQGVESELRTKYLAVHSGESVVVIVGSATSTPKASSSDVVQTGEGWFTRMLHWVGL